MNSRQRKKCTKRILEELALKGLQADYKRMTDEMESMARNVQNNMTRLKFLISDQNSQLSRFPNVVKDFATDPPIHNGEYIVWFMTKDGNFQTRKYTFVGGKWYTGEQKEVSIRKHNPAMYQMVPTIADEVKEIYRRRTNNAN